MRHLPEQIYSIREVREIDRRAIESRGIPGYTLMCRAGAAAAAACRRRWPDARHWLVLCGAGNNAGDGYVVATEAARAGLDVTVVALTAPEKLVGDAARAWRDWLATGGSVATWQGAIDDRHDLIVDAILGSGLERPVEGRFAEAVKAINASPAPVMAIDMPTGIHGDTGMRLGHAVAADCTMTFVARKPGLYLADGTDACGELQFDALDIPRDCSDGLAPVLRIPAPDRFRELLAPRQRSANKGDFGHVLVVGGGPGMPGAAIICGESALRAGAGKVSVATDAGHAALLSVAHPELMAHAITRTDDLDALLRHADVIAIGPGLGMSSWAEGLLEAALATNIPLVLDADALNLLAQSDRSNAARPADRIITPHPGEAARLLGQSTGNVQRDRRGAVTALQERFGGVAVLKGANTLVASSGAAPFVCTTGNPGMATAGMGDALTGIISALLAQGLSPEDAALVGVEAHARAGDLAAATGERGMLVTDLLAALRKVINPDRSR